MATQQDAASAAAWGVAIKSLQVIPHAVASRSLPKEKLHWLTSQAEVDCSRAELPALAGVADSKPPEGMHAMAQMAINQASEMYQVRGEKHAAHNAQCVCHERH